MTLKEIQENTNLDHMLQQVIKHVQLNDWHKSTDVWLQPYKQVKDELSVSNEGIILRRTRIVISESLQQQTIKLDAPMLVMGQVKKIMEESLREGNVIVDPVLWKKIIQT